MALDVNHEIYVVVAERDVRIGHEDKYPGTEHDVRPIVWEQYVDAGSATIENCERLINRCGGKYGEMKIAKLEFID